MKDYCFCLDLNANKLLDDSYAQLHICSDGISIIKWPTMPPQWHHIQGKQNPDDPLTPGITVPYVNSTWLYTPKFMHIHKSSWPFIKDTFAIPVVDLELKNSIISHYIPTADHRFEELLQYHSCWTPLFQGFAWSLKIRNMFLKRNSNTSLSAFDVKKSKIIIILRTQQNASSEEILKLYMNTPLLVNSNISSILP